MGRLIRGMVVVMLAGCGDTAASPIEQCKEAAATSCAKLFECWTSEADRARLMLGANVEACSSAAQARCEPPAVLCEQPRTWDGAVASACIREFGALTCAELRAGATPASCSNTCK